ncbi:protein TSSC4 [Cephus cinctus]|uniref:U5 small nuclear ribonucleoprotein TSSC4 n=1 Tax=Cephus cinctus TaxID=211228 RepID=A0AAJ7BZ28_CEPCN|nr:protein TSSC4 [Cephus cinctus]
MHAKGEFRAQGVDTAFASRQKLLLEQLSRAEKECSKDKEVHRVSPKEMVIELNNLENPRAISTNGRKRKTETKQFRGKESLFKRPGAPAPRVNLRSIPDHHKNPHKWTKYSLDDVSNEDMTEHSNAQAAFSFLRELRARKEMEEDREEQMDIDHSIRSKEKVAFKTRKDRPPIEFKRPKEHESEVHGAPVIVEQEDCVTFQSSKIIMPEYVVGQKRIKQTRKKDKTPETLGIEKTLQKPKPLKLDHLEELDEEV